MTMLLLAIFVVALVAVAVLHQGVAVLRRIEHEVTAWRVEHPAAFVMDQLVVAQKDVMKDYEKSKALSDALVERWGGKTVAAEDIAEFERLSREAAYEHKHYINTARYLHLMIEANGRVLTGRERMGDATSRVFEDWTQQTDSDLMDYIKARKGGQPAEE